MQPSGPVSIAAGGTVTLEPPSAGIRYVTVVIANASPYACQVTLSGSGPAQWLQAWSVDAYVLAEGDIPQLTASLNTDTSGLLAGGHITASWYLGTDTVQGTYPAALSSSAVAAEVFGNVSISGTTTVAISGTPTVAISGTPTVSIGNTPTVNVGGSVTVGNINAGTVEISNASGINGVNIAPRSRGWTSFEFTSVTSVVLLGGTTSPAYNLTHMIFTNSASAAVRYTVKDTFTAGVFEVIVGVGNSIVLPMEYYLQAGAELLVTTNLSSSSIVVSVFYG